MDIMDDKFGIRKDPKLSRLDQLTLQDLHTGLRHVCEEFGEIGGTLALDNFTQDLVGDTEDEKGLDLMDRTLKLTGQYYRWFDYFNKNHNLVYKITSFKGKKGETVYATMVKDRYKVAGTNSRHNDYLQAIIWCLYAMRMRVANKDK